MANLQIPIGGNLNFIIVFLQLTFHIKIHTKKNLIQSKTLPFMSILLRLISEHIFSQQHVTILNGPISEKSYCFFHCQPKVFGLTTALETFESGIKPIKMSAQTWPQFTHNWFIFALMIWPTSITTYHRLEGHCQRDITAFWVSRKIQGFCAATILSLTIRVEFETKIIFWFMGLSNLQAQLVYNLLTRYFIADVNFIQDTCFSNKNFDEAQALSCKLSELRRDSVFKGNTDKSLLITKHDWYEIRLMLLITKDYRYCMSPCLFRNLQKMIASCVSVNKIAFKIYLFNHFY